MVGYLSSGVPGTGREDPHACQRMRAPLFRRDDTSPGCFTSMLEEIRYTRHAEPSPIWRDDSRVVHSSRVEMSPGSTPISCAFKTRLMILPLRVLGSELTKSISDGMAMGPSVIRTW